MGRITERYVEVIVESYIPHSTSGLHGPVHIRPVKGQDPYTPDMQVRCSKLLSDTSVYPLGTRFKLKAKLTDRLGGKPFLHSPYTWAFEVLKK
jgi:hypothetical protein